MNVSEKLCKWYEINKRILPWREELNPYHIWISEIILQQTRVNQGMSYYLKFIEKFPSIEDIATASVEEILLVWQGLGYYTRARNLHKAACIIAERYEGNFPEQYEVIRKLPGIGDYTAAAIASLAFNQPYPAIDGNVYRVLSRIFGIYTAINTSKGKRDFMNAAWEIMDYHDPGKHNQAMIELGALICLPRNPKCTECPISTSCFAFQKKKMDELPVKQKKLKITDRYFYYLVVRYNDKLFIKQRNQSDIWAKLYEFPMIEMSNSMGLAGLMRTENWKNIFRGSEPKIEKVSKEYLHKLSHQILHVWFIEIESPEVIQLNALHVSENDLGQYPFPRLIERYLFDKE